MKRAFVLLLLFTVPGLTADTNAPAPGRYQLVAALVELDGKNSGMLFKIDTLTGEVSRYMQIKVANLPNGSHLDAEGFIPVASDLNQAINDAKKQVPAARRAIEASKP